MLRSESHLQIDTAHVGDHPYPRERPERGDLDRAAVYSRMFHLVSKDCLKIGAQINTNLNTDSFILQVNLKSV